MRRADDGRFIQRHGGDGCVRVHTVHFRHNTRSLTDQRHRCVRGLRQHQNIAPAELLQRFLLRFAHAQRAAGTQLVHNGAGDEHVAHKVYLQHVRRAGNAQRDTRRDNGNVARLHKPVLLRNCNNVLKQLVGAGLFLQHHGDYAPGKAHLVQYLAVGRAADDWARRAEFRNHARRKACFRYGHDGHRTEVVRRRARCVRNGRGHVLLHRHIPLLQLTHVVDVVFGALRNADHRAHGLHRVRACGRLAAQHNGARAVVDRVRHVGRLRTRRARILDHRVEHLRRRNDLLAGDIRLVDELLLQHRDLLHRDLDAKVAARHHNAVRNADNVVDVLHAVRVFNLRNDANVAAVVFFKLVADHHNILCRARERGGDKLKIFLHAEFKICAVFFADIRHGKRHARHIDALIRRDGAVIQKATLNVRVCHLFHDHFNEAVVDEDMRAAVYVLRQVLKRDRAAFRVAGALVRRQCVLLPVGQHHLFGKLPRADLRALRVEQNGDRHVKLFSQLFHHIGAALLLLMRAVRHIQARHVHAAQNQLAQHSLVIGRRTQRTYDLGFSHLYRPLSFSQTPWPAHQCGLFFLIIAEKRKGSQYDG